MTPDKDDEEIPDEKIPIEVQASSEGQKPTKEDLEKAIHQKLRSYPTHLFMDVDKIVLICENVGGKRRKGGKGK
jgi:hypothetical protein